MIDTRDLKLKMKIKPGTKIPKFAKITIAKQDREWVMENYPEWFIEIGCIPAEFRDLR